MRSRRRSVAEIAVLAFITAACTGDGIRLREASTPGTSRTSGLPAVAISQNIR